MPCGGTRCQPADPSFARPVHEQGHDAFQHRLARLLPRARRDPSTEGRVFGLHTGLQLPVAGRELLLPVRVEDILRQIGFDRVRLRLRGFRFQIASPEIRNRRGRIRVARVPVFSDRLVRDATQSLGDPRADRRALGCILGPHHLAARRRLSPSTAIERLRAFRTR